MVIMDSFPRREGYVSLSPLLGLARFITCLRCSVSPYWFFHHEAVVLSPDEPMCSWLSVSP